MRVWEIPITIRRGGKLRYLYQYLLFFLASGATLLRLHLANRFVVVHVHSLPDFQVFSTLPLKLWRVPVVLDLHEAMPEILAARFHVDADSIWFRGAMALERLSYLYANHVIVANDGIRNALLARGMPPSRATTIYNPGEVPAKLPTEQETRSKYEIPDSPWIVHAGGINRERDLETLLRALSRVTSRPDIQLVVAGDGSPEYIDELRQLAIGIGLTERVHFLGRIPREDALALMAVASVGLITLESNPLTQLAWPTRIVEYANLTKPLVVPRLPFIQKTLCDAALYYTPGDAASLAKTLDDVFSDPVEASEVALRAHRVLKRFKWADGSSRLVGIYRALIES